MKRYLIFLLLIGLTFWECDNSDSPELNLEPEVPVLVSPEDYQLLNSTSVTFQWNSVMDPEGEEVTYNLQLSENAEFTRVRFSDELSGTSFSTILVPGRFYYWRVRAIDASKNSSEYSKRKNLIIQDEAIKNYPPFPPDLRFPDLDEEIDVNQAKLGWESFDIDDSDLIYNIYLGTEFGNLTLYAEDIEENEVTLNLDPAEFYYWRVDVIDPLGQVSSSPIWWFKSN